MRPLPARCASAALALIALAAAGSALALPPEPASAPKGAHVAAGPPPAAVGGTVPGITPNGNSNAPYDITSEGVEVLQPQRLVIFKGNVEVTQDTARLRTPELQVFYKAKPAGAATNTPAPAGALGMDAGGMDHMIAAGPVYYITPTQTARADAMTYYADPNVITMTGHVILVQGKSVAKGDKLVMDRKTGQSNLISDSPATVKGRVRVILYPQQQQPAPAAAAKPH